MQVQPGFGSGPRKIFLLYESIFRLFEMKAQCVACHEMGVHLEARMLPLFYDPICLPLVNFIIYVPVLSGSRAAMTHTNYRALILWRLMINNEGIMFTFLSFL